MSGRDSGAAAPRRTAGARRARLAAVCAAVLSVAGTTGCAMQAAAPRPAEPARPTAAGSAGVAVAATAVREWPNVRPLTTRTFEPTPERRARGEYLVEGLLQCVVCHSERDWTQPGAPPVAERRAAGVVWWERDDRRLVAPNLTPDDDTGIGRWSDDMLARAIREGASHDGRPLHPQMWYGSFRELSDEDLAAVVTYLRTLPPIRNPLPRTQLRDAELARFAAGLKPILAPVPARRFATPAERGAYLLAVADCAGCHTSWHTPRMPGLFGGGNEIARNEHRVVAANLTPDATGLLYSATTFREVMRTGRWNTLSATMPWIAFRHLDDGDLDAMHAALASTSPVAHAIDNRAPPTQCAVCGGVHGGGERNVLRLPTGVKLDAATLAARVGRYRFADFDETATLAARDDALWFSVNDGEPLRMIPTSATRFAVPGWTTPVEFVVDADGRVRGFRTVGPWSDWYERLPDATAPDAGE